MKFSVPNFLCNVIFLILKPGSHQRHKHKIDTKTKHYLSSGTCKYKTTRIFLCFVFCSALGLCLHGLCMFLCLCLCRSTVYVAGLTAFLCFPCLSICLCLCCQCEPGLKNNHLLRKQNSHEYCCSPTTHDLKMQCAFLAFFKTFLYLLVCAAVDILFIL